MYVLILDGNLVCQTETVKLKEILTVFISVCEVLVSSAPREDSGPTTQFLYVVRTKFTNV